jgi:hypothetical protein
MTVGGSSTEQPLPRSDRAWGVSIGQSGTDLGEELSIGTMTWVDASLTDRLSPYAVIRGIG